MGRPWNFHREGKPGKGVKVATKVPSKKVPSHRVEWGRGGPLFKLGEQFKKVTEEIIR